MDMAEDYKENTDEISTDDSSFRTPEEEVKLAEMKDNLCAPACEDSLHGSSESESQSQSQSQSTTQNNNEQSNFDCFVPLESIQPSPPADDQIHTVDSRYNVQTIASPPRYNDLDGVLVPEITPRKLIKIQGADIKMPYTPLYHIYWTDKTYSKIQRISLLNGAEGISPAWAKELGCSEAPPTPPRYLAEIFETTPYGIIKKNRTGIGATSLELSCPRNSIIVVPTKALAYNKVQSSRNPNTGISPYLYVGGPTGSILNSTTPQDIIGYTTNPSIMHKKLLVVADSLGKVIDTLGSKAYSDYFLMVDEIDSYQIDGTYRPNLEKVIDYYFKFNLQHRCLVSATVKGFSHPQVKEEPVLDMAYSIYPERNIRSIHTNNINQTVCTHIVKLREEHPEGKILIAFNEVKGILKIIDLLPESMRSQCAILCSSASQENAREYYQETLLDNHLPKPITFMTCLYFTGIDIDERYHLISVADVNKPTTLLSIERFTQIHGRCRAEGLVLSDIIIYKTKEWTEEKAPKYWEIKYALLKYAEELVAFAQSAQKLLTNEYKPFTSKALQEFLNDLEKETSKSFFGSQPINIIRKNIDGEYAVSYFNIDALCDIWSLRTELYNLPKQLVDAFLHTRHYQGSLISEDEETEETSDQLENETTTEVTLKQRQQTILLALIDRIPEVFSDQSLTLAQQIAILKRNQGANGSMIINTYLKMSPYIDALTLLELLKKVVRENNGFKIPLRNLRRSIVFWALAENHPLKLAIQRTFGIGQSYNGAQIQQGLQTAFVETDVLFTSKIKAVRFFKRLVVTSKDRTHGYKIQSYYPDIPSNLTPLRVIPVNKRVSKPLLEL